MTKSSAETVAKNTLILYGRMAITVFISLYTTRLVLQELGASDFGLFSLVGGIIAMLGFLQNTMTSATQRFISFAQGEGDTLKQHQIFNVSILLHLITGILVVCLLEICGSFFFSIGYLKIEASRMDTAKWIYHFAVTSVFISVISVPYNAVLNAHENMLFTAFLSVFEAVAKLGIALLLGKFIYDDLIIYGALVGFLTLLIAVVRLIYCQKKYQECKLDMHRYYNNEVKREMLGFAGWSFWGASSSMVSSYGQTLVINMFFGTTVNAAHSIANQISGQLSVLGNTLVAALNPNIVKSGGGGQHGYMLKATITGTKLSFFLLAVCFVPMIIEADFIMDKWLTNAPVLAVMFCQLQLFRNLLEQLFLPLNSAIGAKGNIRGLQTFTGLIYFMLLPAAFAAFYSGYPPVSIYYVFIFGSLLLFINTIYFSFRHLSLKIGHYIKGVIVPCIGSFLLMLFISLLPKSFMVPSWWRFIIVGFVSTCTLIIYVLRFGLTIEEQILLKRVTSQFLTQFKNTSVVKALRRVGD